MTAPIDNPGVIFTGDKASYSLVNGNAIQYQKVGGIFYHVETPDAVVMALEQARSCRRRVRLYYGDVKTGKDWLEENDVKGYVGNSIGRLKVSILVHNRRCHGGGAILDQCIIKVKWTTGGIIYQHAKYHSGTFTIREIAADETFYDGDLREKGFTHAVNVDGNTTPRGLAMPNEPKPRITLLYIGCRDAGVSKPLHHLWYDLSGIENSGEPLMDESARHQFYGSKKQGHKTKNIAFAQPGAVYSFEKSEGGVYGSTAHYLGRWACEEDVLRWTAEHNAIDRTAELAAQAQKENKEHLDWTVLEPFRRAYNGRLNYRQQQMLLAQVMQYITKFGGSDE